MSTTSSAEKRREASPDDRFGLCMHDFLRGWRDDTDNRLAVGWEASAKFWDQSHSVLKKETNAVWPAIENYSIKEIMTGKGPYRLQGVVWSWSLQPMCFQDTLLSILFPIYPPNLTRDNLSKWQFLFDWQVPLNCHHGRRVGSVCVCNEGWKTKTNNVPKKDLRYIYDWCNVKIEKSKRAYQRALMQAVSFTLKHFISTEFLTKLL